MLLVRQEERDSEITGRPAAGILGTKKGEKKHTVQMLSKTARDGSKSDREKKKPRDNKLKNSTGNEQPHVEKI